MQVAVMLFCLRGVGAATPAPAKTTVHAAPPEFEVQPWEKILFAFIIIGFVSVAGISTALKIKYSVSAPPDYQAVYYMQLLGVGSVCLILTTIF